MAVNALVQQLCKEGKVSSVRLRACFVDKEVTMRSATSVKRAAVFADELERRIDSGTCNVTCIIYITRYACTVRHETRK